MSEFGLALEAELANVEGKNKRELKVKSGRILSKWLTGEVQYRDPATSGHAPQLPTKD